ncbi:MAG: hypothetical protein OHK0038_13820 [Flammeovirgaceae bacterium]
MHDIEPFHRWEKYYIAAEDENSPFYGRKYTSEYLLNIYGYYIHPLWDDFGSETLYIKLLFVSYNMQFCVIEVFGEWNDTLYNDIMHLKRNVIDQLSRKGIKYFILIGENVLNFHGSDDSYYEEWFEEVEDGWIVALNFRDFVLDEMSRYNLDWYVNFGGSLNIFNWRTLTPQILFEKVNAQIVRRLG